MALAQITQSLTSLPTAPDPQDPSTFDARADAFVAAQVTRATELDTWTTQANALATAVNLSQTAVEALSGYVGSWSNQTGAANVPYAVLHSVAGTPKLWALADDIADVTASTPSAANSDWIDITPIVAGLSSTLTVGYDNDLYDAGTKSTGTFTPAVANGHTQKFVNGGAHAVAPPTENCFLVLQGTNNASAGAQTTSGFTVVDGDDLTTTNGDDFLYYITVINSFSHLTIKALQ